MDTLLVITNLPDRDSATRLAEHLIEQRLAACVSVMAQCQSVYRWEGRVEAASEVPVFIKTSYAAYARLEDEIRSHHPYDLPEIVAVKIERGLAPYLEWVAAETIQS